MNNRTETPSFALFTSNLERVDHFFKIVRATSESVSFNQEWNSSILDWVPVMLVTFTEAYLQDLLVYVAALDVSVMGKSEQTTTYGDVIQAQSIPDLAADLRARWARSVVDDGGPQKWSKRLPQILQFPPERYPSNVIETLETLWGVRHVVVHVAGIATRDFVRRHPEFDVRVGERILFSNANVDLLLDWYEAVLTFAAASDEPVVARTAAVINRAASDSQK